MEIIPAPSKTAPSASAGPSAAAALVSAFAGGMVGYQMGREGGAVIGAIAGLFLCACGIQLFPIIFFRR